MELDVGLAQHWLEVLHGDSEGYLHVCATGDWSGQVCETVDQALSYIKMMDLQRKQGIYLRATTVKTKTLPAGSRGHNSDTACLSGLWADIDIAGPGHQHDPRKHGGRLLPQDEFEAQKIIEQSPLPTPTLWIHSGGGLYPWWLLEEPFCSPTEDQLQVAIDLSRNWQRIIAHWAKQLDRHYGAGVGDLARVMRIPGTVNRKVPDREMLAQIVTDQGGPQYKLDELVDITMGAMEQVEAATPAPPAPRTTTVPNRPGEVTPGDGLEQLPWDHELLLPDWQVHHTSGQVTYWTRPGKNRRDGYSATTGFDQGRDRLYVFTTGTELPVQEPLTKFAVYTHRNHGGDFAAAARKLRKLGFGDSAQVAPTQPDPQEFVLEGHVVDSDPQPEWSTFSWDDLGNAQRFAHLYRRQVRWLDDAQQWMVYADGRWKFSNGTEIGSLAQDLVLDLPKLEAHLYDDTPGEGRNGKQEPSEQDRFLAWVSKQRSDARIKAIVSQARYQRSLHAQRDDFDKDPLLLNCRNGVLDLRTAQLSPHDPDQLLTQQANIDWDPDAECPQWENYLAKTMPDDDEREYLQRISGYSISGDTSEQTMFIHHGYGANGKSVYLEVMGNLLGDYSIGVQAATLMAKPYDGVANEDVARMVGKRFLRASETDVGKKLNEAQVKLLTSGDDVITARPLYKGSFDFRFTGKIHLATNHEPQVSNADSIWRRLQVIGWDVEIKSEERDRYLAQRILAAEKSGVLAWAVRGFAKWYQEGLRPPASASLRLQQYRDDQDVTGEFVADCVEQQDGGFETFPAIYRVYELWCQQNGVRPMSGTALSKALQERGLVRKRNSRQRGFADIRVVTPLQRELGELPSTWPGWSNG